MSVSEISPGAAIQKTISEIEKIMDESIKEIDRLHAIQDAQLYQIEKLECVIGRLTKANRQLLREIPPSGILGSLSNHLNLILYRVDSLTTEAEQITSFSP